MDMNRRDFVWGGAGMLLLPSFANAQTGGMCTPKPNSCQMMKISGLYVDGPLNTKNPPYNKLKGVLYFQVNRGSQKKLNAYWNTGKGERECVELIKRYAWLLGFYEFSNKVLAKGDFGTNLPVLGHGHAVANRFASYSSGGFAYVRDGAKNLPKAGAVISIDTPIAPPYGHVGIVCNHDEPSKSTTKMLIKVFEQNMPSSKWSEVEFTKQKNGTWSGKFYVGGKAAGGRAYSVLGWADPTG